MSEENKVRQIRPLQGKLGSVGPLHKKRMEIRCKSCGNEKEFNGEVRLYPTITIERIDANHYDVTKVSYDQDDHADEIPLTCGVCNSNDLHVKPLEGTPNLLKAIFRDDQLFITDSIPWEEPPPPEDDDDGEPPF